MSKIKTRFAPSPTGYLHIGSLRTALYNFLYSRKNSGKFILRIEDTDQSRYVAGSEISLIETLQKIGLEFDEGPFTDKDGQIKEKGQNGPYFQSKRLSIYQKHCQQLIVQQNAYYCFCSEERLLQLREKQQKDGVPTSYDGLCRKLSENEVGQKISQGQKYVVRLKVPEKGEIIFRDLIRGEVKFQMEDIDDQVLMKSDGYPTYHLANVIDDRLMGITDVIRAEEWLSSTPKHILLYQFFGWDLPQFSHLPLLLNPDRSKLSKRQGDVAVEDYLKKGYLPESLINYVALMGWHPSDEQEIFSLKELIKSFDLSKVQKAGAVFDIQKLNWFNSHYIRQKTVKELAKLCQAFWPEVDLATIEKILSVEKDRLEYLSQLKDLAHFFIKLPDYEPKLLIFKKSFKEKTLQALSLVFKELSLAKKWKKEMFNEMLSDIVKKNNLTNGDVFWPVRVALSGLDKSPSPEEIMEVLGQEESLSRLKNAMDKLEKN